MKPHLVTLHQRVTKLELTHFKLNKKHTDSVKSNGKNSKILIQCNTKIAEHGRNGNVKEAEMVFHKIPIKSTASWTAMLTAYAQNGQIKNARKMFDEMPKRNTVSYNAMISAYIGNGCNVRKAYELFSELGERNLVSYAAMIMGFVKAGKFQMAEKLYREAPHEFRDPACSNALINGYLKMGKVNEALGVFENMAERDVVSWSAMIDGLCRDGRVAGARNLFDRMPDRNVVSWSAMIDGYMGKGFFQEGFRLFMDIRREGLVGVNSTTMTIMFKACGNCGRMPEGMQIHGLVSHMGFEFDNVLSNSVITMYCMFGCTDMANKVFCTVSYKDIVTWNSLISGYVHNNEIEAASMFFDRMPKKDLISWTAMITGFTKSGRVGKAIELFDMLPEKDDFVWTAIISGFVNNNEYEEALHWYARLMREGCRPNPLTISSVLAASAALAALNEGLQIHTCALKMSLEYDLSIQNSLISFYSKCGNVIDAYRIFLDVISPNVISYNSIINGFAQNGFGEEALSIYKKMQSEGHEPNHVTFLAVLSACTHAGIVEEGWNLFNTMKSQHGIEPEADHYACIVDLLGRAGLLDEAIDLIHSMPFKPHSGVWGAILGASKIHLRLDLAKLAAQHIAELEPKNATPYVVLSNLYSAAGKMIEGDLVRKAKNLKGIKKSPGCSWIIMKDNVHLFLAGDQLHGNIEEIKATILTMDKEMQWLYHCGC
ncbi:pentatricopeptide repeat-containing protein At1g53600, mitochondrial [Abrus precatorius]|uniref:Pentatricopeptide repeat-containing protein At1g53600, mitochondrial n=1 Tax=Abrus precatorius TaxID=3816 RepID=A0A8B8KIW2_ABRPR|nr:pentatricopeptide repeat-containing protein At1g53600, mitochondrial [Abrus precatorius]